MFQKNPLLLGLPALIKRTEKELLLAEHLLAILRAQSGGHYSEDEVEKQLRKTLIVFEISAFNAGVRELRKEDIFKVHPDVSAKRDQKVLDLEKSIKASNYRLALLNELLGDVTFLDEFQVIASLEPIGNFDTPLFLRVLTDLQSANIIFPLSIPSIAAAV